MQPNQPNDPFEPKTPADPQSPTEPQSPAESQPPAEPHTAAEPATPHAAWSSAPPPSEPSRPAQAASTTPPPVKPTRRTGIFGPAILILIGVAFLASNLGIVQVNVWELMWRLWPVWLIAIGLRMMFGRRSGVGSWIAFGLLISIIGGGVWFFGNGWGSSAASGRPVAVDQALKNATRADVTIRAGVGEFVLAGGAPADKLGEGNVYELPGDRIRSEASESSGRLAWTLQSEGLHVFPRLNALDRSGTWQIHLNEQVPMAMTLSAGVGRSQIDLSRLTLTSLNVQLGVGETTITLPAKGKLNVDIKSGIGKTTVQIPRGMAARIRARNGIGSISVDGNFQQDGDYRVTPDYASATDRLDIDVMGGLGEIRVEQVNP